MRNINERMEMWRKLLEATKPEGWSWQPPSESETESVTPKEPPENIKFQFDELLSKLPDMEREILRLKFIDGLNTEEISQMVGSGKMFITVIERGAIERIAKMVGFKEQDVYSWLAWWGKKKSEEIEAELKNLPLRRPSPDCPSLDRLYIAHLRWDWTEQEKRHVRSCDYCRYMVKKVRERIWHPSSAQLWKYVTRGELSEEERLDIRYHLETDKCRRCEFIVKKILSPVALLLRDTRLDQRMVEIKEKALLFCVVSKPSTFAQPTIAASLVPVTLSAEGFAGETQEEVMVENEEKSFSAQLKRERRGWVARAEARNVPIGSKVLFVWFTPEGVEKIRCKAEFKLAFRDWLYAEAVVATEQEQLGEGYFVAVLSPD